jgi:glutamate dehydrogenase (NAD(P)+)
MRAERQPALTVEYTDPEEGFKGWLVIDALDHSLCAGGMRLQPGLTRERLAAMARNMTRKMRICGLRVDGAKCGIDYDPAAPGKQAAMARFMAAIKPYIMNRYSMGPDLNVRMAELEEIGHGLGLPSVKMAVARAQGWDLDYFSRRYQVTAMKVNGWSLAEIRAGHGVAAAVLAVLDHLGIPYHRASVAIQGFGTLAKATAYGLYRQGAKIAAFADCEQCIISNSPRGLDVQHLLKTEGTLLPRNLHGGAARVAASDEIFDVPCDIMVPAALEDTVTERTAPRLQVRAVVPGANLAVTPGGEELLHRKGILVLPDFLAGSGGSLSMEGLFAAREHPGPAEVLDHVTRRMARIVSQILLRSVEENISPTLAALRICEETMPQPDTRPYGEPGPFHGRQEPISN